MTRTQCIPLIVLLATLVAGCDAKTPSLLADTARVIGVTEPPPPPSRTITILIDPSVQSPATPGAIGEVLDRALADIATRPVPSCVVVSRMGATVSELATIGTACVEPPLRNTTAQHQAEERFLATARERLLPIASRALAERPRQSPIAATLSRLAWSGVNTEEHFWLVLSDLREESDEVARLECGPLPSQAAFQTVLQKEKLLEPRSLSGVDVRVCFFGFTDANRLGCASSVRREVELRELWRGAFQHASARSIAFESAAPDLASEVRR